MIIVKADDSAKKIPDLHTWYVSKLVNYYASNFHRYTRNLIIEIRLIITVFDEMRTLIA